MIGNSPIDLEGSFIDVNGAKYAKTRGLLELLIMKQSTEITNSNMENYRKILEVSSANKSRYGSNEKIRPHNNNRFKYIIAPMFKKQGAVGLPTIQVGKNEYYYGLCVLGRSPDNALEVQLTFKCFVLSHSISILSSWM